jgi:two-component system phosphate regulon response regulator OmpR
MTLDAHLLIVDDDERIRSLLQKFLIQNGFLVSAASDAGHARRIMSGLDFDLIIMGETEDRILGLEAGADDYLTKPFEPKELLLRINVILRRAPKAEENLNFIKVMHMGDVRYDVGRGEMWQGDARVRLTATESHLMRIFSSTPGLPVSRTSLVEQLGRDGGQAQERAVDVQITRLRRKIESDPKQPRYLQTVRGTGYMLAPEQRYLS